MHIRLTLLTLAVLTLAAPAADNAALDRQPIVRSPSSIVNDVDAITIPQMLSYQGKLTDTFGLPVADTVYAVRFRLYTQPSGGTQFWEENQNVRTTGGLFSVLLGTVTPIGSVPDAGAAYLGMAVSGGAELAPRLRIVSAAYAYKADTANYALASGGDDQSWVRGTPDSVLFTIHRLGVARGGAGNALQGTDVQTQTNFGVSCTTAGIYAAVGGGLGNVASNSRATVAGGWLNTAGGASAVVAGGWSNSASGDRSAVAGGYSNSATADYAAVAGGSYNTASGDFSTVAGGRGDTVRAYAGAALSGYHNVAGDAATDSGATVAGGRNNTALAKYATVCGGQDNVASDVCATVAGGWENSASDQYAAVGGGAQNNATATHSTVGGGWNNSATGVSATVAGGDGNTAAGTITTIAGGSENHADNQGAVPGGYRDTALGSNSFAAGWHSKVESNHSNSAAFTGSHTTASNQVRAQAFSTGSGIFTIDHPQDPLNRILNQYAVGSSEQILSYRGVAVVGPDGRVAVNLPDYFDALNRNPMVQLTGVGTSDVYVAERVNGNRFTIGGKPGTEVYWTVTGERKDQSAEIARILTPVEQAKTGSLVGHSLDDDGLANVIEELDQKGLGGNFRLRTAAGRQQAAEPRLRQ